MDARTHTLKNGQALLIREVLVKDAPAVVDYVRMVGSESPFLTFGPGEFEFTEAEERTFIGESHAEPNRLFILGSIDRSIVSLLNFSGGRRSRLRHAGEFGLTVRRPYWGLGIGSLMVDTLIAWARSTHIVTKINLRVRADNGRAIALYERKGFAREGTITREMLIDGVYFDNHVMGLEL
jgi:RimJ/RimL family protein N-acetyltransferase